MENNETLFNVEEPLKEPNFDVMEDLNDNYFCSETLGDY